MTITQNAGLKVGIVGYGLAGRVFHAPFIRDHAQLNVVAIVTTDPGRARQAAEENPGAVIASDLGDIIDGVDVLIVASPPARHASDVGRALDAGCFVVVDKPFAPDVQTAEALIARAAGRLTVFHNRRWDGDFRTIADVIDSGALGEVFEFESAFEHWDPRPRGDWKLTMPVRDGGGVAMDLGSHLVDQALLLFGAATEISADLRAVRDGAHNDDVAVIRLVHDGGVRSTLRMSRLGAQPAPRFRVSGRDRSCLVQGLDPQEGLLAAGTPVADLAAAQAAVPRWLELSAGADGASAESHPVAAGDYRDFYARIATWARGDGEPPVSPESALATLRVLEEATALMR